MQQRKLGTQGLEVPAMGLGCMGMSWAYGATDDAESTATIHRALELGCNFFDTAEIYGPFYLEENLGAANVHLSAAEVLELDQCLPPGAIAGPRYAEGMMADIDR